ARVGPARRPAPRLKPGGRNGGPPRGTFRLTATLHLAPGAEVCGVEPAHLLAGAPRAPCPPLIARPLSRFTSYGQLRPVVTRRNANGWTEPTSQRRPSSGVSRRERRLAAQVVEPGPRARFPHARRAAPLPHPGPGRVHAVDAPARRR